MSLLTSGIEKVRENLNLDKKKTLLNKLNSAGFKITNLGHVLLIDVKDPKKEHPRGTNDYLPVGKIVYHFQEPNGDLISNQYCSFDLGLVNLDKKFPRDYHTPLRNIFKSV